MNKIRHKNLLNLFRTSVTSALIISLSGCAMSWFNANGAIVEDKEGKFRTIAVKADRRVIIFDENAMHYCAEPPPDVAQNLASALHVAANVSGADIPATANAELSKAIAVTAQKLMNRSQGLQFYRDGMYFLCQGYFNGMVSPEEMKTKAMSLLDKAYELIRFEIEISKGQINSPPSNPDIKVPDIPSLDRTNKNPK